ncbi:MAG: ribosome small subunit-dependent GTPase A [Planctomycetes bacterium]|nr:ribosome small subunit-dependent GTPase A [Planctomycetota bacterium]
MVRVDSRMCHVETAEGLFKCRVRGLLFRDEKRFSRPVAVGDRVILERRDQPPHVVVEVLPRRTYLSRRRGGRGDEQVIAANVDQAILVQAVAEPALNERLLDRMLVAVEQSGFAAVIVINKVDLLEDREGLAYFVDLYRGLGYRVIETSVPLAEGVGELREALHDRISVVAGPSGAGKSALLTAIQPGLALRSAEVSQLTGKGRHTTTHASLLALEGGGWVVDTPGVREFGVLDLEAWELGHHFVEFREHLTRCRFRTCTHDHEEICGIKEAVAEGAISEERYDSYRRILASLVESR